MIRDVDLGGPNWEYSASPAVWFDLIHLDKIVSQSISHVCGFSIFLLVAVGLALPVAALENVTIRSCYDRYTC